MLNRSSCFSSTKNIFLQSSQKSTYYLVKRKYVKPMCIFNLDAVLHEMIQEYKFQNINALP